MTVEEENLVEAENPHKKLDLNAELHIPAEE